MKQAQLYSLILVLGGSLLTVPVWAAGNFADYDASRPRIDAPVRDEALSKPMDLRNIPDFVDYRQSDRRQPFRQPQGGSAGQGPAGRSSASPGSAGPGSAGLGSAGQGTPLQASLESGTVPVQTRIKLIVEYPVDAKTSRAGDIFEGHVKDDLYLGRTLLLPRGSLVRGRIVDIQKPRLLSRAAKVGLKLEQIVTPVGEVIPLDAALEFQKGLTNKQGKLDPGTSFGTRVESSVKTVAGVRPDGSQNGALLAANIATLGAPMVATAIGSSAVALFSSGDNVSIQPGQEIEILLTNDLGLQLN